MDSIEYIIDEIDSLKEKYKELTTDQILKVMEMDRLDVVISKLNELINK